MEEENEKNQELFIIGQAFFDTGISEVEDIIEKYISCSKEYQDSYSVALLNNIKSDIAKIKDRTDKERDEALLQPKETSIYFYTGKIIKIYDKTLQCGYCIKKDYINENLSQIQGICLDFQNCQIIELSEKEIPEIEETYCEDNNELYQLAIKEFQNRDYGKFLYENIKNSFLVRKKEQILER